jgi:hypothetical protein
MMPNDSNDPSRHGLISTSSHPSRRDAIRLASAAATVLVCKPAIALGTPIEAVEPTYHLQKFARQREYVLGIYQGWVGADAFYDGNAAIRVAWDMSYRAFAEVCMGEQMRPYHPDDDTALRAWCRQFVPPEPVRCWQQWPRLDGLSRRYQWLDAVLEASLFQYSDTWWAYDAICRKNHYRYSDNPKERAAYKKRDTSKQAMRRAAGRVLESPAITLADRQLRKRAIETRVFYSREFAYKYRRAKILQKIRSSAARA